jgi:hypothetical protein
MARDFEDIHNLDELSNDELRGLVREKLAAHNGIDVEDVEVQVEGTTLVLSGRVGTEQERRTAEHLLTDVLGMQDYRNDLMVTATRRSVSPEAIDEHLVDEEAHEGLLLGDRPVSLSPEAEHLHDSADEEETGTTDVHKAIEEGTAWIPPESPTPEGRDDGTRAG